MRASPDIPTTVLSALQSTAKDNTLVANLYAVYDFRDVHWKTNRRPWLKRIPGLAQWSENGQGLVETGKVAGGFGFDRVLCGIYYVRATACTLRGTWCAWQLHYNVKTDHFEVERVLSCLVTS